MQDSRTLNLSDAHTSPSHSDPAHGAHFESWSCRPAQAFDVEALRAWLRAPPTGLLRLKGVLRSAASPPWAQMQFAGRHGSVRAADAPRAGAALVAIGLRGQLPVAVLESFFNEGKLG